jgi:hypothetical protein
VNQLLHYLAVMVGNQNRDEGNEQGNKREPEVEPLIPQPMMRDVRLFDFHFHEGFVPAQTRIGIST